MTSAVFDLEAYFERVQYRGGTDAGEETLRDLHTAHALNVPFENLDVFYGRPILLDEASLFRKMVGERQGGYCFEMNGLFSLVLGKMGFRARNLLARVILDNDRCTTKTHQVILVEAGGRRWLADVGFGNNGLVAPLILEEGMEQDQFSHTYRITNHSAFGHMLQKKEGEQYLPLYAFTLEECFPDDFLMANHFTSTFPGSFFLTMRMCTRPTRDGRVTLTDNHFKVVKNGEVSEQPLADEEEFTSLARKHFGLDPDRIQP
ncbi:MAG: arylamine N-acetyltransferase [Acidobacteriota bacterium]|jgi:N-hydroxyarylamine O-acetyltransferase|nr:arylamine N-acetyltransferase [Acidobacteriota bacterium]NLT32929.1 arylamine N-acetyltransferase [Acidobacteriota bacterium]